MYPWHARPKSPKARRVSSTFVYGFHVTFLVCAAIAAIGIAASLVRGKERT